MLRKCNEYLPECSKEGCKQMLGLNTHSQGKKQYRKKSRPNRKKMMKKLEILKTNRTRTFIESGWASSARKKDKNGSSPPVTGWRLVLQTGLRCRFHLALISVCEVRGRQEPGAGRGLQGYVQPGRPKRPHRVQGKLHKARQGSQNQVFARGIWPLDLGVCPNSLVRSGQNKQMTEFMANSALLRAL